MKRRMVWYNGLLFLWELVNPRGRKENREFRVPIGPRQDLEVRVRVLVKPQVCRGAWRRAATDDEIFRGIEEMYAAATTGEPTEEGKS